MSIIKQNNIQPIPLLTGGQGVEERGDYTVDITELLNDTKTVEHSVEIWRIITNGYPYKKLEGLTDEEAYFATKQAIYCVIIPRDTVVYRGLTTQGEKVVEAIKSLVAKSADESINPKQANLQVNKKGTFVEDDNYYSQMYTVSSDVTIRGFQVAILSGFPTGSFIADSNGNKKDNFTTNETTFKVMVPKTELTQNISGTLRNYCTM